MSRLQKYAQRGGGNSNIFGIFTPKIGEMIQFDEHIFQMGWFNHQLVKNDPMFSKNNGSSFKDLTMVQIDLEILRRPKK